MSVKYLKSETHTDWVGGGDRKGMELCLSGMAPCIGEHYSVPHFPTGEKTSGETYRQVWKSKTHLTYI